MSLSTHATLRAYYERAYRPMFLATAKKSTVAIYDTLLSLWEAAMPQVPALTLEQINNAWLGVFREKLLARKTSTITVNKYLRALNALLAKAGPAGPRNRDGLGLIEHAPWVRELKVPRVKPRAIPLDVLGCLYRAAKSARVPQADGIDPAEWWRGLIVVASQVGIRKSALLGLTWRCYGDEQRVLRVPAEIDKAGVERAKPLNEVAVKHLNQLWCRNFNEHVRSDDRDTYGAALDQPIFPWPYRTSRMFYIQWHALQHAAGLPLEHHHDFHDLKKTCGTQLGAVAGAFQVQAMLDHASVTTSQHYCAGDEQLRAALERMPHPVEFDGVGV